MSFNHLSTPSRLGIFLLFILMNATLIVSCGPSANMTLNPADKIIEMTKGPCYGRCPVFTLTIYKNGIASYKGERYTDRLGTYVKKLDKAALESIIGEFKRANMWQFRDTYRGRIPDMQSVSIMYAEGGKKKTVTGKEIRPNAVKWLESQLDQIANSDEGWILKEAPSDNISDDLIPNELIVELDEEVDPEEWAKKYIQADMLFEKQLAESGYWIFSFDDALITPEEMLEQVRQDEQVISAEFNKEIYNQLDTKEEEEDGKATPAALDKEKKKEQNSNAKQQR
jgi:hypothetical protein